MRTEDTARGQREAAAAFAGFLVIAFFLLLRIGPEQGFYLDEWDYLTARTAWSWPDLLQGHNEHWSTLPILVYRAWYRLFGLDSYLPYRGLSVAAHLAAATAMRLLLRRMGLGPWMASAIVLPWILFGSGWQDIVWGFQAAWSAALALCLTQLLLADHDGPRRGRDATGIAAGIAALMSAGIAVPVTAAVGLALLLRRGWRVAALHVVPLALVYGVWSRSHGDTALFDPVPDGDVMSFLWSSLSTSVSSFSWVPGVGAVVAASCVVALSSRFRGRDWSQRREQLAIPAGFALGAVAYLYVVASGRASFGTAYARSSRYQHVVMLLLLPVLGAAVLAATDWARSASTRQRRGVFALVLGGLWIGVPGNISEFSADDPAHLLQRGQLERVEAMAAAVQGRTDLPADGQPLSSAPRLTVGWLREATHERVLTARATTSPRIARLLAQSLELMLVDGGADRATCTPLKAPLELDLAPGERVSFEGTILADVTGSHGPHRAVFNPAYGDTLHATAAVHVVLQSVYAGGGLCR